MSSLIIKSLVSAAFVLSSLMPAAALPVMPHAPAIQQGQSPEVIQVRDHRRGFYRHRHHGYYNGHRGYRHHRHGYRRHNGYWFPPAAFALGAIIGGAIASQPHVVVRPGYLSASHVRYCYNRYRSYRQYDNSFQPYHGPRRICRSPYY
ncbi:BA14K-like protein [Hoeflea marina]|uniref:Lectin-like protein BA14k n=1 Tax=Hoeflea marina TaxID=274592 RepID=A0A317PNG5_9HYPH|nr:BA14K family protein [Hoeflea marina]PWW01588.1 BA14K-like protein [Hoeflea marina]